MFPSLGTMSIRSCVYVKHVRTICASGPKANYMYSASGPQERRTTELSCMILGVFVVPPRPCQLLRLGAHPLDPISLHRPEQFKPLGKLTKIDPVCWSNIGHMDTLCLVQCGQGTRMSILPCAWYGTRLRDYSVPGPRFSQKHISDMQKSCI